MKTLRKKRKKWSKVNKKKNTKKATRLPIQIISILIGALCGFAIGMYGFPLFSDDLSIGESLFLLALALFAIYAASMLQIIFHETGHFLFGRLTGYRFVSFRIGNLMWIKENGRLKFCRMSVAGTGGQCLMTPPDLKDDKIPYVLYNLGGPLANLICSSISFLAYFFLRDIPYFSLFLLLLGITGLGTALINGIPMRLGTVDNDGYNAFSLGKSQTALHSFWIQMKANEMMAAGIRTKDLPKEWFVLPNEEEMKNSMTAVRAVLYGSRLMDEHNFSEAAKLIDRLHTMDTAVNSLHRSMMTCDRLYCELILDGDEKTIERLLTKKQLQFMNQMKNSLSVIRTSYAYALLWEKDEKKAEAFRTQFEKMAARYPYRVDAQSERELLQIAAQKPTCSPIT